VSTLVQAALLDFPGEKWAAAVAAALAIAVTSGFHKAVLRPQV